MLTLDEHNARVEALCQTMRSAGVACPECGVTKYANDLVRTITTIPPVTRANVVCKCGYTGVKVDV